MAKPRMIGEGSTFWQIAFAVFAGLVVFAVLSQFLGGFLLFLEIALAAAVVYYIARR